jgi:glycerol dehydrogenase-like iron-containing ADH family enzyme
MDITPQIVKNCELITHTKNIYLNNIFFHIDSQNTNETLFVYDGNIKHIVQDYLTFKMQKLCLSNTRALPTIENANKIIFTAKKLKIKKIFAFGTGTINDLCKYASHCLSSEYTFCPTALSMNGISSATSSLFDSQKNIKVSLQSQEPTQIIIQPDIIAYSPLKFTGSAIMDSLAFYTAYNDLIFASTQSNHYQINPHIHKTFQKLIKPILSIVETGNASDLRQEENILKLFQMLCFSGLAMNYYNASIPFSGGEHAIAHCLESKFPELSKKFLHGEIISAILPFYSNLQINYSGSNYISKDIIKQNNSIDFLKIANFFNMPTNCTEIGISEYDFKKCVQEAKFVRERPSLLHLI